MTGNGFNVTPDWRLRQIREAQREARAGNPRSVPADPVREHVDRYLRTGGYVVDLSRESGVSQMAIYRIRQGQRRVYRENAAALLSVGLPVTTIGCTRRLQALAVAGFTSAIVEAEIGCGTTTVQALRQGNVDRRARTKWAPQIARAYRVLDGKNPADYGLPIHVINHQKRRSARMGYAPAGCWDSGTIDDPDAIAEWTGACGTGTGYTRHRDNKIRVWEVKNGTPRRQSACSPCLLAISLLQQERKWENKVLARLGMDPLAKLNPTERQIAEKLLEEARRERNHPERDAAVARARHEDSEGQGMGELGDA